MKRTVSAVLTSLVLLPSYAFARESPATNPHKYPLKSAIALEAYGLFFGAPIGAGIGAAVGGIIGAVR